MAPSNGEPSSCCPRHDPHSGIDWRKGKGIAAGIYAIPLFSVGDPESTLGVFVIDYTGSGGFRCVEECAKERPVQLHAALGEEVLTEARSMLGI